MSDLFASSNGMGGSGAGGAGSPGSGAGAYGSGAGGAGGAGAFGSGAGGSGVGFSRGSSTSDAYVSSGTGASESSSEGNMFPQVNTFGVKLGDLTGDYHQKNHSYPETRNNSSTTGSEVLWGINFFIFSIIILIGSVFVLTGLSSSSYLEVFLSALFWPIFIIQNILLGIFQ